MQYSLQFDAALEQEWEWTERYAAQPEILRYAEHVADRFQLRDGILFGKTVTTARFDDQSATWTVTDQNGHDATARFCVMATGCLSQPNWPKIDGYDRFGGQIYHTALWPHDPVDFAGQRVAVIGTGSSGIQSIPRIAQQAAHLTVFQRTANYAVPAQNHPLAPDQVAKFKADYPAMRARARRTHGCIDGEYNTGSAMDVDAATRQAEFERRWQKGGLTFMAAYGDFLLNKDANDSLVAFVHGKIKEIVTDPETAEMLCPDNIIGGKRLCVDIGYFETFNKPHVDLVDIRSHPISAITETGVQLDDRHVPVDAIVIATGFDAMTGALSNIDITGRGGVSLRDVWADGPRSYLGLSMFGFPNFFTITGPGSPSVLTNMLPSIEHHVEWITDCIDWLDQSGKTTIEADAQAQDAWWQHVQEVGAKGLKTTTDSWYLGANVPGKARVFMPYNGGHPAYRQKCEDVVANGYDGFVTR